MATSHTSRYNRLIVVAVAFGSMVRNTPPLKPIVAGPER